MTIASPPRRLDAAWLREGPLAQLLTVLDDGRDTARIVGGAVRNALLGEPIGDVDIATTARPRDVIRRAEVAGFKAVPTGIEHGTVTVVVDHQPFEVTTLREDIETYGRHAKVAFGRDWRRDAERRDFTMNALSAAADGTLYDYVGGLADLEARRVRFIGDPAQRIAEDYLRILRFFRFHAAYGSGPPDPAGLRASVGARAGLEALSRERVRLEMLKLLTTKQAAPTLAVMAEAGLLVTVLGGIPLLASFANMIKLERVLELKPDAIRRLGALAASTVEDAGRLRERLRLANAEHERLLSMVEAWWRISPQRDERTARALLYRLGPAYYTDRVLLAWSRSPAGARHAGWRELANLPNRWVIPAFPLKAADLIARGVPRGPALGAALRVAEDAWIVEGFPLDSGALAAIAAAAAGAVSYDSAPNSPSS